MKICVVGKGRSGKDTICQYLAEATGLRFEGTTSLFLAEYVAEKKGCSAEEAYKVRHSSPEERMLWFDTANEIREKDPLKLVRRALVKSDITGGLRCDKEMLAAIKAGVFDLVLWVERKEIPEDPTMKFDSSYADLIIENNQDLEHLYFKLDKIAKIIRRLI